MWVAIIFRYEMMAEWTPWPWVWRQVKINWECEVYKSQ